MQNAIDVIEAVEKNIFECMDYMEDKIKDAVEYLTEQMQQNLNKAGADNNYIEGYCDALIDLMYELEIKNHIV